MASSANTNPVPELYRSVIEDVINEVRGLFLDEGVDEQVLHQLKTMWESKLLQYKAVEGFHSDEQTALQAAQQQQVPQPTQPQPVILPPQQQQGVRVNRLSQKDSLGFSFRAASSIDVLTQGGLNSPQQEVIVEDNILQHMGTTGLSAAATTALALPTGVGPFQDILTNQGQISQVLCADKETRYTIQQPQQPMQSVGVQSPVIQQALPPNTEVLAPLQGGLPQQTGVIIQLQQIVLTSGSKVQANTQVMQAAVVPQPGQAAGGAAQVQQVQGDTALQDPPQSQAQQQPQAQQPPMMLQVDGAKDDDEDEEEEYNEDENEAGGEDGQVDDEQVEEESLNSGDDLSDDDGEEVFNTENLVVCQFDKISKREHTWSFHLKDGIMNLNGRDYGFSKATGKAELW